MIDHFGNFVIELSNLVTYQSPSFLATNHVTLKKNNSQSWCVGYNSVALCPVLLESLIKSRYTQGVWLTQTIPKSSITVQTLVGGCRMVGLTEIALLKVSVIRHNSKKLSEGRLKHK